MCEDVGYSGLQIHSGFIRAFHLKYSSCCGFDWHLDVAL